MRLLRNKSTANFSIDAIDRNIEAERIMELEIELSERDGGDYEAEQQKLKEKVLKKSGRPIENEAHTEDNNQ